MLRHAFAIDPEDPFGSRPDEKPPRGWDDRFWEEVCLKIDETKNAPDPARLPEPKPGRRRAVRAVHATMFLIAAAAVGAILHEALSAAPEPLDDVSHTLVRVYENSEPDVAVDWARLDGVSSGYVVLQSIDPDISLVLVDRRYEGALEAGE